MIIVALHALFIFVAVKRKWFNGKLPEMYKFPHIEVKVCIGASIGMLNVSLGVLSTARTAVGWKVRVVLGERILCDVMEYTIDVLTPPFFVFHTCLHCSITHSLYLKK